jgi:acyl-CoA thioesterase
MDSASSLSHTVIFHAPLEQLSFRQNGKKKWFNLETGGKRIGDGRGLHKGRIYDSEGTHLISTMQDGAFRLKWKSEEEKLERQKWMMSDPKL